MKINFDTLGTERPDNQHATPQRMEMTDQMVNKALVTCLTIRKMLGNAVDYVEVLEVRFYFTCECNWVEQKKECAVNIVWFTIGGLLSFSDRQIPIHNEKAGGPILYGRSTKQDASSVVSCIVDRLEGMLKCEKKGLENLVSALKIVKPTAPQK